jgi:hypothetical protein
LFPEKNKKKERERGRKIFNSSCFYTYIFLLFFYQRALFLSFFINIIKEEIGREIKKKKKFLVIPSVEQNKFHLLFIYDDYKKKTTTTIVMKRENFKYMIGLQLKKKKKKSKAVNL